ncbi:MAG: ribonuclease III [Caulobacteraceae bacterium]
MDRRAAAVAALESRLDYRFGDRELLERALTHASAGGGGPRVRAHNETLEFLGDRVLGLLAAETLFGLGPGWREGELTRRHVTLVSGAVCARVARGIDLGAALRLAGSTTSQGGRDNDRILGDAMEALIAAIYLDGGLEAARGVFHRAWSDELGAALGAEIREAKTALQEWALGKRLPTPHYLMLERSGPAHGPLFTVTVEVEGFAPARATGPSLRAAEKAAAAILLAREAAG